MDDFYKENILDHYKNPRNFGTLSRKSATASDNIISCGDQLSVDVLINKGILKDIRFYGQGCAISIATASMLSEMVKNKKIKQLQRLTRNDILKMLGITLTPSRLKCALLSLEILQKAIMREIKV